MKNLKNRFDFLWILLQINTQYFLGRLFFKPQKKEKPILHGIDVISLSGNSEVSGIKLPDDFLSKMNEFYQGALEKMSWAKNCILRSADENITKEIASRNLENAKTFEVPEVKDGKVATIRIKNTLDLKGMEDLAQMILPQIEEMIYKSPVYVEKATVYRHSTSSLPEYASILWHSDNHHEGVLKVMVYLSPVGIDQAPFEYLRHKETGKTIHVTPSYPRKYPQGRVPVDVIEKYKSEGFESYSATGPAGTVLIFDDKIIHKGNYAKEGFRDVLVFQLRPAIRKQKQYIDPKVTKSF